MQVSLSSGNYHIISSGQTFLFGLDKDLRLIITADNHFQFSIVLKFEEDSSNERRIDTKINGDTIILNCFNFDDMGTGLTKPLSIAQVEGKEIFFIFWSYLEGAERGKVRSVKYTIFMNDNLGDNTHGN